jgi:hypothetical protein
MLKKLIVAFSFFSVTLFGMHTAEININKTDVEAGLALDLGQFTYSVEPDTTFMFFRFLKPDDEYSDFPDPNAYFEGGFKVEKELANTNFLVGAGIKLNYTEKRSNDFFSLPLSLHVGYTMPLMIPIHFLAQVHYAPEVLSFMDAKNYLEYRLDVDFEIINNALINIGYRDLEMKFDHTDYIQYNGAFYLGLKFKF